MRSPGAALCACFVLALAAVACRGGRDDASATHDGGSGSADARRATGDGAAPPSPHPAKPGTGARVDAGPAEVTVGVPRPGDAGGTGGADAMATGGRGGSSPTDGAHPGSGGGAGSGVPPAGGTGGTGGAGARAADASAGGETAPRPPQVVRRIAVVGDYGGDTSDEAAVAALVRTWNPDAVLTVGDNNYSAGTFDALDLNVGKHYHEFIGSYRGRFGAGSAANRFWPSLGDHDWEAGVDSYLAYFTLPGNERYYDVDLGPVHIYAVNSNAEEPDGYESTSKQALWLKQRLATSTSCFDLVYFHHPPFSSGDHGSRTYMDWPFAAWGAEAVFAGHDHDYERLEVSGIPYFVAGMGGLGLRDFPGGPLPETRFRNADKHGAIFITATSAGTITYEFWTTAGTKLDPLTVTKRCE
jgi:hypothetical protein